MYNDKKKQKNLPNHSEYFCFVALLGAAIFKKFQMASENIKFSSKLASEMIKTIYRIYSNIRPKGIAIHCC